MINKKFNSIRFLKLFFMLISLSICSNLIICSSLNAQWEDYVWRECKFIPETFKNEYWLEFYFLPDNPKYGFACGGDGMYTGNDGVFAKTSDSGKTWYASVIQKGYHAESIYFVDTNIGYVSGPGAIYKTINGGQTWTRLEPPLDFETYGGSWGCYTLGRNNVWLAAGFCSINGGRQNILKSVDGGQTWTKFAITMPNTHFTDIKMYDANGLGYAVSSGYIWRTLNGGTTWDIINQTPLIRWGNSDIFTNWHEDINIFNESILIPMSAGCGGSSGGRERGALGFSRDLGRTWRQFITKGSMFGTFLLNDSTGWGCGYNNEVYYTTNSGASWVLMNCGIPANINLDDLWFINDTVGFVSGDGGIFRLEKKAKIAIIGDSMKCRNKYVELRLENNEFDSYAWFKVVNGDTIPIMYEDNYYIYNVDAGTYFARGYYHDNSRTGYCDSVQSQLFSVNNYDVASEIKTNSTIYCQKDTAIVWFEKTANIDIASSYWIINGEYFDNDTLEITTSSEIAYHFVDRNGCDYTISKVVEFNQGTRPILQYSGNLDFCVGETATIKLENYYEFTDNVWFLNDTIIAQNAQELNVSKQGKYYVSVSKNNNCADTSDILEVTVRDVADVLDFSMNENPFFIDSVKYGKSAANKIKVFNKGDETFVINSIFVKHKFHFTLPLSQFPIAIPPKETRDILIYYTPSDVDVMQFDTLIFADNCSYPIVPISGIGKRNFDNVISECDIEIRAITNSVNQKKIFSAGNPAPNPVFSKTRISYKIELSEATSENNLDLGFLNLGVIDVQLFDIMGNRLDVDFARNILNINQVTSDTITETGELIIDTITLGTGSYFIRINCEDMNVVLTIIKQP